MSDKCGPKCLPDREDVGEMRNRIATEMSTRLFGGAPILPGSNEDVVAFLMAGVLYEAHSLTEAAYRETDPRCMCCDSLFEFAARRGIYRQPAAPAKGYVRLTGTPGAAITYPLSFTDAAGRQYQTDATFTAAPTALDASGEAVVRIEALVPGEDGNKDAGETLTIGSPPPGINSTADVIGTGLTGGAAEEDCESLRERVLARLRNGAVSANVNWIIERIREWPGVTRVCASTCDCLVPSFYVFMDGTYGPYGVPPLPVLNEIEDYIFGNPQGAGLGLAPVGAKGRLVQAQPESVTINIHGLSPLTPVIQDAVQTAINDVFSRMVCPGGCMCLKWIDDVLASVEGVQCYERVEVVPGTNSQINGTDLCMDCDYFPVVGAINYL